MVLDSSAMVRWQKPASVVAQKATHPKQAAVQCDRFAEMVSVANSVGLALLQSRAFDQAYSPPREGESRRRRRGGAQGIYWQRPDHRMGTLHKTVDRGTRGLPWRPLKRSLRHLLPTFVLYSFLASTVVASAAVTLPVEVVGES